MKVAVLGAGIQGVCVALELARRGVSVDLFDRSATPVTKASRWNEGKIHLGLIYANDPSLRTAEAMLLGSLDFEPLLARWLESGVDDLLSEPFVYLVHRDSLLTAAEVEAHFHRVTKLYQTASEAPGKRYLGSRPKVLFEGLSSGALAARYDRALVQAAFRTAERSIDPGALASRLREAVAAAPAVRFHGGREVAAVKANGARLEVSFGENAESYDHIVNTLWEDRLKIDASLGLRPERSWLFRYKLAIHVSGLAAEPSAPSTTIMLGAFGDIVNFGRGDYYLSWYPECRLMTCDDLAPPRFEERVTDATRRAVLEKTVSALARVVPNVGRLDLAQAGRVDVEGGYVFAWGKSDVDDPGSELHERFRIGVHSHGRYHSIDTGKYCMAPRFALEAARRITGAA